MSDGPQPRTWPSLAVALSAALAACAALVTVELTHNGMTWHWRGWWPETVGALVVWVVVVLAFAWSIRRSRRTGGTIASVILAVLGAVGLPEERGSEVKLRTPSPGLYRVTSAALMQLPLMVVAIGLVRRRSESFPKAP